jgi:hypothetical protein
LHPIWQIICPTNFWDFPKTPGQGYGRFVREKGRQVSLDVIGENFRFVLVEDIRYNLAIWPEST